MGWLSSASSSIGSAVGKLFGSGVDYHFSKKLANLQFEHQKTMMQNAHQWEVEDLRKSGLNPILSAGGSGASGSAAAPVFHSSDNVANSAMAIETAREQQQLLRDQQAKTRAETQTAQALAQHYSSSALQNIANTNYIKEQASRVGRENAYFRKHPDMYDQRMINNSSSGTFGQFLQGAGALKHLFGGNNSSAFKSYKYEDSK